jgi:hypothetical protein
VKFQEVADTKLRPVVLANISIQAQSALLFPIYSYRKWFDSDKNQKSWIEIKNLAKAGLSKRSFVNLTRAFYAPLSKIANLEPQGILSAADIHTILINYYGQHSRSLDS